MTQNVIDSNRETLGGRIETARKEATPKITIATIARELEVDPRTVARWQSDDSTPSVANLTKLAALLGRPPSYFLDDVEVAV